MNHTTSYGQAALSDACDKILSASHGSRNSAFFRESVAILELVAGGVLDDGSTTETLFQAASQAGLPRQEAAVVLKSARRRAQRRPRRPDEPRDTFVPEVPVYPAETELRTLQEASHPLISIEYPDPEAEAYLESRGLDPLEVSRRALVRSVQLNGPAPCVVPRLRGVAATSQGYRLSVELVDGLAVPRSCVLRRVVDGPGPKSLTLKGARRKLVFANAAGRALLTERGRPALWGEQPLEVLVVEGEIDFLTAATEPTGETMRAVFGIASGAWGTRFATCIPKSARVVIATDNDEAGDKLAAGVRETLQGLRVGRWKPHIPSEDFTDAGGGLGGEAQWTL